ncbi:phasin family protein [Oxalobacteraceae bacterium OM1]|nr:phasin family protein [Oxalobacteraceae bacterium OM1]
MFNVNAQDKISAAARSNLTNSFEIYSNLASKTLEGMEKLVTLNLTAAKASMEESAVATRQFLAVKDPQEFMALLNSQAKPNFEKALSYASHVANIASGLQTECSKAAEARLAQIAGQFNDIVEETGKNAPAGSETFINFMQSAVGNATNGYEQFSKTAKQAVDAIEQNLTTAVGMVNPAATTTVKA